MVFFLCIFPLICTVNYRFYFLKIKNIDQNVRGARKLVRTPHVNKKKGNFFVSSLHNFGTVKLHI